MKKSLASLLALLLGCTVASAQPTPLAKGEVPAPDQSQKDIASTAKASRRSPPPASLRVSRTPVLTPAQGAGAKLNQLRAAAKAKGKHAAEGHYIVLFKDSYFPFETADKGAKHAIAADGENVSDKVTKIVKAVGGEITALYPALGGFSIIIDQAGADALKSLPEIESVSPEGEAKAQQSIPFNWAQYRVDTRSRPTTWPTVPRVNDATGVDIFVVDSGINKSISQFDYSTNPSITSYFSDVSATFAPLEDPLNPQEGDTSAWADRAVSDDGIPGHGTSVASILVGKSLGNCYGATIHSVRWTLTGSGSTGPVVQCLDWVLANMSSKSVVTLSLATFAADPGAPALNAAVNRVIAAGAAVVVAAGNAPANSSPTNVAYVAPANVPDAITVGATTPSDTYASFSNYGPGVDIWAPGDQVGVAPADNTIPRLRNGTSFAVPYVAAAAAVHLRNNPPPTSADRTYWADVVRNMIVANATSGAISGLPAGSNNYFLYADQSRANWQRPNLNLLGGAGTVTHDIDVSGTKYDQVLMGGPSVTVQADAGQIVRCSWIDEDGDILQAELSGSGILYIELENPGPAAEPVKYNQPGVNYVSGRARLAVIGASKNTYLSVFSVGRNNSANQSLFKSGVTYDGKASIANVLTAESKSIAAILLGNAVLSTDTDFTGIYTLANVDQRLVVRDIKAYGTAQPNLVIGDQSQITTFSGRPIIAGGDLIQPNGLPIRVSSATPTALWVNANQDSHGNWVAAQSLSSARLIAPTGIRALPFATRTAGPSPYDATPSGTTSAN